MSPLAWPPYSLFVPTRAAQTENRVFKKLLLQQSREVSWDFASLSRRHVLPRVRYINSNKMSYKATPLHKDVTKNQRYDIWFVISILRSTPQPHKTRYPFQLYHIVDLLNNSKRVRWSAQIKDTKSPNRWPETGWGSASVSRIVSIPAMLFLPRLRWLKFLFIYLIYIDLDVVHSGIWMDSDVSCKCCRCWCTLVDRYHDFITARSSHFLRLWI